MNLQEKQTQNIKTQLLKISEDISSIIQSNTIINENIFSYLTEKIDNLPPMLKEQIKDVSDIVKENKTVVSLYGEVLAEIPFSTSLYQDVCVQMETHFTPHRKLRQTMLELDGRLRALYAAKDGYIENLLKFKKAEIKVRKITEELQDPDLDDYEKELKQLKLIEYQYELEKAKRELESSLHLIKDAMIKVVMYRQLAEKYKKEVEESGLSFEESEVIYYVLYLTKDAEAQLKTNGRIDTGTYGAIAQLPEYMRKKVLQNINFIIEKIKQGEGNDEYLFIKYYDLMVPKKTGENEFDGFKLTEFIELEPIKLLTNSKQIEEEVNKLISENHINEDNK